MQSLKPVRTSIEREDEKIIEREEEPLSPWSCAFHGSESGIYIMAILGVKNRINPSCIKDNLMHDLMRNPRFCRLQPLWDVHSLGDGFSLISLLLSSARKVSDPEATPSFPVKKKKEKYEEQNNLSYLRKFWLMFRFYWNSMVDVIMLIATLLFFKDTKTPISNSTCGGGSSGKRIVYKIASLDDIKLVKNATNSTVNDVIMAVLQASLSRYLNRLYGSYYMVTILPYIFFMSVKKLIRLNSIKSKKFR
ncbi:hypothetical protein JCGZ_17207 [Jatropha curcas]|uniref:Uncharacterized protein n=1 Tax=Jatropha curcas TaxID=180498 RepID=A0A067LLG4_JATCU|nr:hypothetical protein JCGZ_17207 [Jatropha curcas]